MTLIEEPREELKRADHLLFVTLKYTRTCDVIMNTIHRLIGAFDLAILRGLEIMEEKGKIEKIPSTPFSRAETLRERLKRNKDIKSFISFYFLLKKITRSEYTKREEFRKNVCMVVENEKVEIDVLKLHEFYERTREFVLYMEEKFK